MLKNLAESVNKRLIFVGLVLMVIGGFFWWSSNFNKPENVFWGMLDNSLATTSVTRHTVQDSGISSVDRYIRLQTGSTYAAQTFETTKQAGTSISKETIGTPSTDYARYSQIKTNQRSPLGEPIDFSNVEGIWGKSTGTEINQPRYFVQALLGTVPLANLNSRDRNELIEFMRSRKVYRTNFDAVEKVKQNGRKVYIYKVQIDAQAYFALLQQFVKKLGLEDMPGLDPSQYRGVASLDVEFTIDKNSRQLVKITYIGTGQEEIYTDYGLIDTVKIPDQTIPIDELQTRIQNL